MADKIGRAHHQAKKPEWQTTWGFWSVVILSLICLTYLAMRGDKNTRVLGDEPRSVVTESAATVGAVEASATSNFGTTNSATGAVRRATIILRPRLAQGTNSGQ